MKKLISLILSLVMVLSFAGCGQKASANWQEHYDLGIKYVNEAKYEEAVLEFNKALEIDPKQAPVYIALAEVYVRQENYTAAQETIDKAITEIGETEELTSVKETYKESEATPENTPSVVVRTERTNGADGQYFIREYDQFDNEVRWTRYNADGSIDMYSTIEYDSNNNAVLFTQYAADDSMIKYITVEYDNNGNDVQWTDYNPDGSMIGYTINDFDSNNVCTGWTNYNADGTAVERYIRNSGSTYDQIM